jgi:hypothetical protein
MFNPFKFYRRSQEIQYNWIRNHPVQYIALNATLLGGIIGYVTYQDRKELRKIEKDAKQEFDRLVQIN